VPPLSVVGCRRTYCGRATRGSTQATLLAGTWRATDSGSYVLLSHAHANCTSLDPRHPDSACRCFSSNTWMLSYCTSRGAPYHALAVGTRVGVGMSWARRYVCARALARFRSPAPRISSTTTYAAAHEMMQQPPSA
jgi:hypothetical protein